MIEAVFQFRFLQYALLASLMVSIIVALIGPIIVEKKMVMMTGGVAHTSYGGVGLSYFLGIEPMIGAVFFAISSALGIGYIKRNVKTNVDILVGMFWSLGMALGIFFIRLTPGYPPNIQSFLFGNILAITNQEMLLIIISTLLVILFIVPFLHFWKIFMFDEEYAEIIGIKTKLLDYLLYTLIAFSVVSMIKVVGIILVISLFSVPIAISSLLTKKYTYRMILSGLISFGLSILGLVIAYYFDLAAAATIVVVSVLVFVIVSVVKNKSRKSTYKQIKSH